MLDCRGEGVPAAAVWCTRWPEPDLKISESLTDGDGFFVLARIPVSETWTRVTATAPGLSQEHETETIDAAGPQGHVVIRLWDADTVRGRVLDADGVPVVGASVTASNDPARVFAFDPSASAITDGEGRFELAKVPLGQIAVKAWAPGYVVSEAEFWHTGPREGVDVILPKGEGVTLSVDVKGLPAGVTATVRVLSYARGGFRVLPAPLRCPIDSTGRWTISGLPGYSYDVSVFAEEHSFQPRSQRTSSGEERYELTFVAVADARNVIHGTLRDRQGTPLAGERLLCRAANGGRRATATTSEDGSFSLASPLAPGTPAVIYLVDSAFVTAQEQPGQRSPDLRHLDWHEFVVDPATEVEIVAQPTAWVFGTMQAADGRPIAFERVTLQASSSPRNPNWMAFEYGRTDRQGRFRFTSVHPPDGPIRVARGSEGYATVTEAFRLRAGQKIDGMDLVVAVPGSSSVHGRIIDDSGKPVAGAQIVLHCWDEAVGQRGGGRPVYLLSGRDGRFGFPDVEPGWFVLGAQVSGDRTVTRGTEFEVHEGKRVEQVLEVPTPSSYGR